METTTTSTPLIEQLFMKRNATLSIFIGFILIAEILDAMLTGLYGQYEWLESFASIAGVLIFLLMMITLVRLFRVSRNVSGSVFWFGNYQDEYLNHVNLKGYKYVFNIACFVLIAAFVLDDYSGAVATQYSIGELARVMAGVIFLSYGLPVWYLLRSDNADE